MSAAAEAEVVAAQLARQVDKVPAKPTIDDLRNVFQARYPKFHTMEVLVPRSSRKLTPWSAWAGNTNPTWWTAHNQIKHDRHNAFGQASLFNALEAAGVCFVCSYTFTNRSTRRVPWNPGVACLLCRATSRASSRARVARFRTSVAGQHPLGADAL